MSSRRIRWPDALFVKRIKPGRYVVEGYRVFRRDYTWHIDGSDFGESLLALCRTPYGSLQEALEAIVDHRPDVTLEDYP